MAIDWISKIKRYEEEEERKKQENQVTNTLRTVQPRTITLPVASENKSVMKLGAERKKMQQDIEARRAKAEAQKQERARKEQEAYNNVKKLESEYNTSYKWLLQSKDKTSEEYKSKVKEMTQKSDAYKEALEKYNKEFEKEAKERLRKSNKESFDKVLDTAERVVATPADVAVNVTQGFLNIPEGIADAVTHMIAQSYENKGNKAEADRLRRNAMVNQTQDIWLGKAHKYLDEKSYMPEIGDEISQGVGYSATLGGLNMIPGAGKIISDATLMTSAMGSGLNEAFSVPEVSSGKAWTKAVTSAGIEVAVEKLFGILGYGGSSIDDMLQSTTKNIRNGLVKAIADTGLSATGEAIEELLSYAGDFLLSHGLDLVDTSSKMGYEWNSEEVFRNMFVGFMSAGVSQGPVNVMRGVNSNTNQDTLPTATAQQIAQGMAEGAVQGGIAQVSTVDNTQATKEPAVLPRANEKATEPAKPVTTNRTQEVASYVNKNNLAQAVKDRMQGIVERTNKISSRDVELRFEALEGNRKAQTDGNTITIDISKASLGDLIHEITHNTESGNGYTAMSDYILTELDKRGELQAIKDDIRSLYQPVYESEGRTFTDADLDSEIVARYTEKFAGDANFVNKITQADRNLAQKICDWIREKVNYYRTIKNLTAEQRAEYDELRRAEKLWLNALKSSENNNTLATAKYNNGQNYSIGKDNLLQKNSKSGNIISEGEANVGKEWKQNNILPVLGRGYSSKNNSQRNEKGRIIKNYTKNISQEEIVRYNNKATQDIKDTIRLYSKESHTNTELVPITEKSGVLYEYKKRLKEIYNIDLIGYKCNGGKPAFIHTANPNKVFVRANSTDLQKLRAVLAHEVGHLFEVNNPQLAKEVKNIIKNELYHYNGRLNERGLTETAVYGDDVARIYRTDSELYLEERFADQFSFYDDILDMNILEIIKQKNVPAYKKITQIVEKVFNDVKDFFVECGIFKADDLYLSKKRKLYTSAIRKSTQDRINRKIAPYVNASKISGKIVNTVDRKSTSGHHTRYSLSDNITEKHTKDYWQDISGKPASRTEFSNENGRLIVMERGDGINSIYETYVEPESRNQGLGTKLLTEAINKYKNSNLVGQFSSEQSIKNAYKLGFRTLDNASLNETLSRYKEDTSVYMEYKDAPKYSLSDNQGRTLTKEQQEFFKDSKVRDDNGKLLTMYHGTNTDFNIFKRGKKGYLGGGIYLTDDKGFAKKYTDYGIVKEVYVNIKQPLTVTSNNPTKEILNAIYGSDKIYNNRSAKQANDTYLITNKDLDKLQAQGYDGIVWKFPSGNEYMVFNSNQIKNVDNTNPTSNPDIRYSLSDTKGRELTKEQQDFFKDSQAKDENGNLMVMYHGTPNGGFTKFDYRKRGSATDVHGVGDYGKGFYFTPVKAGAESYTSSDNVASKNPQVYEVYLNMKNPLRLDILHKIEKDMIDLGKKYGMWNIPDEETYKVYEKYNLTEEQYVEMYELYDNLQDNWQDIDLSEYGYDGVINERRTEFVVFNSNQIKNTDNTNPTTKSDIRYSLSDAKDNKGRELSTDQAEFFNNSKLKDANGNLKTYYTGANADFTVYDANKMSNDSKWGKGIYLTEYKDVAKAYGDNIKEVYVNMTNPLSDSKKTISFKQANDLWNAMYGEDYFKEDYDMYNNDLDLLYDMTNKGSWADYGELIRTYTGKDGIIADSNVKAEKMIIVFNSNQVKNVDNKKPTANPDVRYSLSDSKDNKGRQLTKGQEDYFKDSKARDDNGNLVTVYHTTTEAGPQFYEFNPVGTLGYRYGDQVVNFFTDSKEMSGSYAGQKYQTVDTKKINNLEEANKWAKEYAEWISKAREERLYKIEENDGKYVLKEYYHKSPLDGEYKESTTKQEYNTLEQALKNVKKDVISFAGQNSKSQYEGYVDIKNPFEMDAKGANWNRIEDGIGEYGEELLDKLEQLKENDLDFKVSRMFYNVEYQSKKNAEKYMEYYKKLTSSKVDWMRSQILDAYAREGNLEGLYDMGLLTQEEKQEIKKHENDKISGKGLKEIGLEYFNNKYDKLLERNVAELKKEHPILDTYTMEDLDMLHELKMDESRLKYRYKKHVTTNDIVKKALAEIDNGADYDGVIIRNVVDYGGEAITNEPATVYVTFNSNQFKGINNIAPTKSQDIRYSLADVKDNKGRELSEGQREYFKDSKVRDEQGRLLEVYHGTPNGSFTIFDKGKITSSSTTHQWGYGFYFTNDKNTGEEYTRNYDNYSGKYSYSKNPQLYAVYLDIKNPLILNKYRGDRSKNLDRNKLKELLMKGNSKWFFDSWIPTSTETENELNYKLDGLSKKQIEELSKEEKIDYWLRQEFDRLGDQNILQEIRKAFETSEELMSNFEDVFGYDGIIVEGKSKYKDEHNIPYTPINQYIVFNSNQIKNVDNKTPTSDNDIRYSLSENKSNARFTEERLDKIIRDSISEFSKDYAENYVVKMSPQQYIDLTITPKIMERLQNEVKELDTKQLAKEIQNIFLSVDMNTGRVIGHEGRHRMLALKNAGVEEVDVVIYPNQRTYDVYNAKDYSTFKLKGQEYADGWGTGKDTIVHNLTAVTYNNIDKIKSEYLSEDNDNDIRYSVQRFTPATELDTTQTYTDGRKKAYNHYKNGGDKGYNNKIVEQAKELIKANHQGRRTKEQWLKIADTIGANTKGMEVAQIEQLAYKSWFENKPNYKENLNRQGQKYVKFTIDEWINRIYESAKKATEKTITAEGKTITFDEYYKENMEMFNSKEDAKRVFDKFYENQQRRKAMQEASKQEAPKASDNLEAIAEKPKGKERKHYKSIATSAMVGEHGRNIAKNLLEKDRYIPASNAKQLEQAESILKNAGVDASLESFRNKIKTSNRLTPEDLALGETLIQIYSRSGDTETLNNLIQDVAIIGTELGQTVQALSLIRKMTPEGQLMTLQKAINRLNMSENTNIQLTTEQTKKIVEAKTDVELQEALSEVTEEIAQQLPLKLTDKLRSWRYLSMLGNPRTHIRNILSNTAMKGTKKIKDTIAGGLEDIVNPAERTRTLKKASKETKEFAKTDASERIEIIANGGKYDISAAIKQSKKQFDNKVINALAEFNSNALEAEDKIFLKSAYADAMAKYMTANNLTPSYLQSGTKEANIALTKAREFATLEAQVATFRQFSWLASKISQIENKNNFTKVVVGGLLPFKKTPINIAKAGIEYSPVGLMKNITYDAYQLKKGKISANQFIDNISKGLTGTSISLIGYFLAQAGLLKASGDDDDRAEDYAQSIGEQQYAIKIGDKSITIDWLSPSAMPLFVGAEFYNALQGKSEISLNALATATTRTLNPLTEMSMLQSFASTLSSFNSEGSAGKLGDMGANMIESYLGQYFPTLVGQLARIIDDTERDTYYTDKKGAEARVQRFINKQVAKTPFLSKTLEPRVDVWGEEVKRDDNIALRAFNQLLNPAYVKTVKSSTADKEVQKLYKASEDSGVLPKAPGSTFSIEATEYKLTPEEYTTFKKSVGKYNKNVLNNIATKKEYTSLSDAEKIKTIDALYDDSREKAKQSYADKNKIEYDSTDDIDTLISKKNLSLANAYIYRGNSSGIKSDKDSNGETIDGSLAGNKAKYIMGINTTDEQKDLLLTLTTSSKIKPTVDDMEILGEKNYSTYYSISNAESREKYVDLVSTGMNTSALNNYINNIGSIEGKKDKNGKTISGTLKTAKANYINSLSLNKNEKLILFGKNYELSSSEKRQVMNYINGLNISKQQKLDIYDQLKGVTIKNGKVYW